MIHLLPATSANAVHGNMHPILVSGEITTAYKVGNDLLPLPLNGIPHLLLKSPDGIGQILSCLFNLSNRGIVKVHFNHPLESAFSANFAGPYHEAGRGLSTRENVEL